MTSPLHSSVPTTPVLSPSPLFQATSVSSLVSVSPVTLAASAASTASASRVGRGAGGPLSLGSSPPPIALLAASTPLAPLDRPVSPDRPRYPSPAAALELLKPVTWFAPMWALGCGVVSAGVPLRANLASIAGAVLLAGPLVCGTSQAANDWFDRHVDAINEPKRPIPSGRIPGRWGLAIAIAWTLVSLAVGAALGPPVFVASVVGIALAWAYSAPPLRLKMNGWWGNAAVGLCYEGLPWFTGAAALTHVMPDPRITALALLYSAGAFGIMVLNDFKAIEGDIALGIRTLPVQLGVRRAAILACVVMALPQVVVIAGLALHGRVVEPVLVALLLSAQLCLMPRLVRDPRGQARFYNATGTTFFVLGMLVSAFAIRAWLATTG